MIANPYWAANLIGCFKLFFQRLLALFMGNLPLSSWASDEHQIAALITIGISCCLVGTFLVLKKSTMVANSLSHTILVGIVITVLLFRYFAPDQLASNFLQMNFSMLMIASLISSLVTLLCTEVLTRVLRVQKDASIGLVFTLLFALGVTLVTIFSRNSHIGIDVIMGNLDAIHPSEIRVALFVALMNIVIFALFAKRFMIAAFDGTFARSVGISTRMYDLILMFLTTITIVISFRAVGAILVLSMIVGPVLIARLFTHRVLKIVGLSIAIQSLLSIVTVFLSRHMLSVYDMPLSTSGLFSSLLFATYLIAFAVRQHRKKTLPQIPRSI